MADAELAWASFDTSVRMYRGPIFKGIGNTNYNPIHPTQKNHGPAFNCRYKCGQR